MSATTRSRTADQQDARRRTLRTLTMLLAEAAPNPRDLKIAFSLGDGYFFHLGGEHPPLPKEVATMKRRMQQRIEEDAEVPRAQVTRREVFERLRQAGRLRTLAWLKDRPGPLPPVVSINNDLFAFDGPLWERTGQIGPWDLVPYPPGVLLVLPPNGRPELGVPRERPALFRAFYEGEHWGEVHGAEYVSEVNESIRQGRLGDLIQVSEALHNRAIAAIADQIVSRKPRPSVVLVSGPSSSGKTSFSHRLSTELRLHGLTPLAIGLDDFYLPRSKVPRTPEGEYDFEALGALDIELFNETLLRLISGETVALPRIEFKTHTRRKGPEVRLKPGSVLVVEGIHGLNPALTPHLTRASTFRVYVSALTHLNQDRLNRVSTRDLRLLRRLVRDNRARGYPPEDTLARWNDVRRGELRHIFPFQEEADVMFNSALSYELNALKAEAEPLLASVKNSGLHAEARRLNELMKAVLPVDRDLLERHVPPTSVLREFIGGSVLVG